MVSIPTEYWVYDLQTSYNTLNLSQPFKQQVHFYFTKHLKKSILTRPENDFISSIRTISESSKIQND